MNRRIALATVACVAMAIVAPPTAAAGATLAPQTYHFTECRGPAGTPTAFDAVKEAAGAAALHLVDGRAIFVAMEAVDVASGDVLFTTPGFTHNRVPTVTCRLTHPVTLALQQVTGIITADPG